MYNMLSWPDRLQEIHFEDLSFENFIKFGELEDTLRPLAGDSFGRPYLEPPSCLPLQCIIH